MINITSDILIRTVDYLDRNRSSGDLVSSVLLFLCSQSDFGTGFVYERDPTRFFRLTESCGEHSESLPPSFNIKNLTEEYVDSFIESGYLILGPENASETANEDLLNIFGVERLLLVPIAGYNNVLLGIIGFVYTGDYPDKLSASAEALAAAARVFSQYISPRIYEGRVNYARASLEGILDHTGIDIYVNDFITHEMLYANKSMAAPYGGMKNFTNKKCHEALYNGQLEECEYCPQKKITDENGNPTKIYSWDYQRPFDGSWFRVFSAAFHWVDGRLAHVVSSVDITESKQNEQTISHMANYDSLTELPNRRRLIKDYNERIQSKYKTGFVMFLDLDGFKIINDSYSHRVGDELLIQIGRFFLSTEETRNIYRNGGDEFVVLHDGGNREDVLRVAQIILNRFKEPWQLSVGDCYVNTSIGISEYPQPELNAEDLLQTADMAMYEAKRCGPGHARFYNENENAI